MIKHLTLLILTLLVISCGHQELQVPEPPPLSSNPSQVIIIRENRFFGFGIKLEVKFDDEVICKLSAGEYVTFWVEPGFHTLGLSKSTITVPFGEEQKYFFLIKVSLDQFGYEIERISGIKGNYLMSKSKALE